MWRCPTPHIVGHCGDNLPSEWLKWCKNPVFQTSCLAGARQIFSWHTSNNCVHVHYSIASLFFLPLSFTQHECTSYDTVTLPPYIAALHIIFSQARFQSADDVEMKHWIYSFCMWQVTKCYSFLDYIFGGLQINFTVCFLKRYFLMWSHCGGHMCIRDKLI